MTVLVSAKYLRYIRHILPFTDRSIYAVIFTRLWSCRLCCDQICWLGCVTTRSHVKWGWSVLSSFCARPFSLEANLNIESQVILMPVHRLHTTLTITMQTNGENVTWNNKTLEGQELPGDCGHLHMMHTSRGQRVACLAYRGYSLLHWIIVGPRGIFYVLPTCSMY